MNNFGGTEFLSKWKAKVYVVDNYEPMPISSSSIFAVLLESSADSYLQKGIMTKSSTHNKTVEFPHIFERSYKGKKLVNILTCVR